MKKDMRVFRKNMKHEHGLHLTAEQLTFLMKWLDYIVDLDDQFE